MEKWESMIDLYPSSPDLKHFMDLINVSHILLKQDLAQFETEWFIETLLFKPVELLSIMASKRNDDAWGKGLMDSFKVLTEIVMKYPETCERHLENIVKVCEMPYKCHTQKYALHCLASICKWCVPLDVARYVSALAHEEANACRAPLALLVGAICEHHPETVADHATTIWRHFLNMLACNKNTELVTNGVLNGIYGLLKNFGNDLPTMELSAFYKSLTNKFITMQKHEAVCFKILEKYADLFPPLAKDSGLRSLLYSALINGSGGDVLQAIYKIISDRMTKQEIQEIVNNELVNRANSKNIQVRYTTLKIIACLEKRHGTFGVSLNRIDAQKLEFELRSGDVTFHSAETILWCIETNQNDSDKLLQTAILFEENIPRAKRKDIVIYGILKATSEVRKATLIFLVTETCKDIESYISIWRRLFDMEDSVVQQKCRAVFEDFMEYLDFCLQLSEEQQTLDNLPSLLQLTSHVLPLLPNEHYVSEYCSLCLPKVTRYAKEAMATRFKKDESQPAKGSQLSNVSPIAFAIAAGRSMCSFLEDNECSEFYKMIKIDKCRDEATLVEYCIALMQANDVAVKAQDVLNALQIIFSRNDVEALMLSQALKRFDQLLFHKRSVLDANIVNDVIWRIDKILRTEDKSDKNERILRRDVVIFLGKYGVDLTNEDQENIVIVQLRNVLVLALPNTSQFSTYKLNLNRILQLAIAYENPKALQTMITILFAHLATNRDSNIQYALTLVLRATCRLNSRGDYVPASWVQQALCLCDNVPCLNGIIEYLKSEKSPGVRRMMSNALEGLLLKNAGSKTSELLIRTIAQYSCVMMRGVDATSRRAGLDLVETVTAAIKDNNKLSVELLPDLIVLIPKTEEVDSGVAFDHASKLFLEKHQLFGRIQVERILRGLMRDLLIDEIKKDCALSTADESVMAFRNSTEYVLEFIKKTGDLKAHSEGDILEIFSKILNGEDSLNYSRILYVLAEMQTVYDFDKATNEKVVNLKDILKNLFDFDCEEYHVFGLEAILKFITNYVAVLLEHQEIMELLNKLVLSSKPADVIDLQKEINNCISTYNRIWKTTPKMVLSNFESWCSSLRLNEITRNIENKEFHQEDSLQVKSLKIYLKAFNLNDISYILTDVKEYVKRWPKLLLKLYSTGYIEKYLKSKMSYLTDVLAVSLLFLTKTEMKSLILEGLGVEMGDIGIRFCRYFLNVFIDYLLRSPFALTDEDMGPCCVLLNDIAKYVALRKFNENLSKNTLQLIDSLWPRYEVETNFTQKYKLLLDLSSLRLKLSSESNPLKWVVRTIDCPQTSRENVMRLIGVLPGGEAFSASYRKFACHVPARLSESGECLRAILDALSTNGDFTLLDILAALSSGDQSKGTWDTAIDSCMASLAIKNDMKIYKAVYTRCWHNLSTGVCDRMMVPLLRYSTSVFCERFFSDHIGDLLSKLRKTHKEASAHYAYQKCLADHLRAFTILQIAFEKIPSSLESPNSLLYKNVNAHQTWHLVKEVCKLCCTLRGKVACEDGADDKIKELHRLFHKRNYKCLCAAICRRRPDGETFYGYIFNRDVWTKIVDLDKRYKLPIRNQWHARTIRESVSLEVSAMRNSASRSLTRTARTRLFLRTLSENPLQYDLMPDVDAETVVTQDLQLIENELNQEEMTATLSALFCHAASLPHTAWLKELTEFLSGDYPVNSKWILAQAVCNCKDELKSHTSALYPALLAVVANSITELGGKRLLNGLHVEILNTLTQWRDKERVLLQKSRNDLNTIAYSLVVTTVEYRGRQYAYKSLMDILEVFVDDFKEVLSLEWTLVNQLFKDIRNDFPKSGLKLIQSVIKDRESLINNLMEVIQNNVQNKCWVEVSKMAELLGNAIGCTENEIIKNSALETLRVLFEKVRKTSEIEYMKMLYYSQQGYKGCCDDNSLRYITNLVQKLSSHNKTKCLLLISSYISQLTASTENVSDMFDTIDFAEIIKDYTKETLQVIRDGVMVMDRMVKRRLVTATVEYCDHPDIKVRRLAFEVMLKALDDTFQKKSIQPSASKRPKYEYASSFLNVLKFEDTYKKKLLAALGSGVSDVDDEISGLVREGVCRHLCTDHMAVRFAECFLLTVYLPTSSSKQCLDLSVRLSALLYLFFSDLRSQEAFKNIKLRDEPVRPSVEPSVVSSKLLTMSSTYIGTFRTYTGRRRTNVDRHDESNAINVEISIDYILDSLLQFSKDNSEAAQTLCIEVLNCLLSGTRPDSFDSVMVELLTCVLDRGGEFTPLAIQMARLFIKSVKDCEIDGFKLILPKLTEICKNTEGEAIVRVLSEDVILRGHSLNFSMGRINEDITDVPMSDLEAFEFDEMLSAFNKLSDWDILTIQERNRIEETLPPLWTDSVDNFVTATPFEAKHTWLEKMLQVLKDENKQDSFKWLRDMRKWPRSRFYNSAVTEAIQWQSGLSINLEDLQDLPGVSTEDCLVKWVARFLARQTYFQSLSHDDDVLSQDVLLLSRSHELRWTKRANEMALPKQALECIRKNIDHLTSNEQLQWMNQKVTALRLLGLKQKNNTILKEALEIAEETRVKFAKELNPDIVEMDSQILLLKNDLHDTSPETLRDIKHRVEKLTHGAKKMSSNTKNALKTLYEVMMSHYDEFWDKCEDSNTQSDVLSNMADVLGHVTQAVTSHDMFVDIVLDKLDQFEGESLPVDVANNILEKLQHQNLDDFAIEQIKKHRNLFSNKVLSSYVSIWDSVSLGDTSKYKQCLQLIADASHLLVQYCENLVTVFKDQGRGKDWEAIFRRIQKSIFENPYAGSDYKLLEDYKNDLYSIKKYDSSEEFKNKAMTILRNICGKLSTQPKPILLLSQLCPALMKYDCDSDNELERLLGLNSLKVIRFDEQVSVFTDSIRRPTVFRVLVSDGKWRRYVVKSGEPLKVDASAQRVKAAITHSGYTVTPLSDDCGIIEYLEDHVRIRDMIESATSRHLLSDVLKSSIKPIEDEIILTSAQVLRQKYEDNCSKVPSHCLRSAIEEKCCSMQDFIMKKRKFENTLVQMTLISSLLGLGDRHLENIMYSVRDGGVCCVDWAAIFKYGVGELPAARLTRNFVAVCNTQALESGLQNAVTMLRKSGRLFAACISMSFKWMGQEFKEKEPYIRKFLNGETASHEITKDVLLKSTKKYKNKYLQLLEEMFDDYEGLQFYSVIDQARLCCHGLAEIVLHLLVNCPRFSRARFVLEHDIDINLSTNNLHEIFRNIRNNFLNYCKWCRLG